jgi:tRNA nucleotidyltransferase (CCA-adding enzyme)
MDPHGCLDDLKRKMLRHTSDAFSEDPLRTLRAVQFSARFNMSLHDETASMCKTMHEKGCYEDLPNERIREEIVKFLIKGQHHLTGVDTLRKTGWMEVFPEIKAIDGLSQDHQWHPEGDVLTHTAYCLQALKGIDAYKSLPDEEQLAYALGVLCHDLGKPATSSTEWKDELSRLVITSPNHPQKGLEPTRSLLTKMGFGETLIKRAQILTLYHMEHLWVKDAKGVRNLAAKLSPANPQSENPQILETIAGLAIVTEADHSGRPPLPKGQAQKNSCDQSV